MDVLTVTVSKHNHNLNQTNFHWVFSCKEAALEGQKEVCLSDPKTENFLK